MESKVTHLTEDTFDASLAAGGITVIDFWASWCGPCRAMAPQFERAAKLRPGYRFAKVDVDAQPAVAQRYAVQAIPTLLVLRDGEPVAAQTGVLSTNALVAALDRIASTPTAAPMGAA
jgi:thioredoxin